MASADAIVIGAGIIGAACAWQLAQQGLQVILIDDQRPGATAAGMGHLVCMDDNPAELALSAYSLDLWRSLVQRMPDTCAWRGCGTLWLAATPEEMAIAELKQQRMAALGIASEMVNAEQLSQRELMLRSGLAGGLSVPSDGIIYAPNAASWLVEDSAGAVKRHYGTAVALEEYTVSLAGGEKLTAPIVVLACGLQADQLLASQQSPFQPRPFQPLPHPLLKAKKGQLAITDRYPVQVKHQLVELGYGASAHASGGTSVAFNVQPRPTGQLLIGSSRQFDAVDGAIDLPLMAKMLQRATTYLPGLAQMNIIRCWTGLRAASADGLPILSAHPHYPWLWLVLGHEGLGVTTALGSAALITAQILQNRPAIDDIPYRAARLLATDEVLA